MLGVNDLKPYITITQSTVECPVTGCTQYVERQRHSFRQDEKFQCPDHKIYISPSTFKYESDLDNLLWKNKLDLDLLKAVKQDKRESRMARDNSEDALSWNVFRFMENSDYLDKLLSRIALIEQSNTELIYWSYSQKEKGAWPELNNARKEFGENLRRSSEPDLIALTDQSIFFIEAKLTATNHTRPSNPDIRKNYVTGGEEWYKQVFVSDYDTVAIKAEKYELFRFWLLGSWLAEQTERDFYLINVVPSEREKDIEKLFIPHIRMTRNRHFKRLAWEDIYCFVSENLPKSEDKSVFIAYFENKTIGYNRFGELQRAFNIIYSAY